MIEQPHTLPRTLLPSKEEIGAMTDQSVLEAIRTDIDARIAKMRVDLEFRSGGDDDWERRCRGALTAHEIVGRQVKERIHRLFARSPQVEADAANRAAKAQRRAAQAVEIEAAATRQAAKAEESRQKLARERIAALDRVNWLASFYKLAKQRLSPEDLVALQDQATAAHASAVLEQARLA